MKKELNSQWFAGALLPFEKENVIISVVAYEHTNGFPARFFAGFIPAVDLACKLSALGMCARIRVVDPTYIANYCNGWIGDNLKFKKIVSDFLCKFDVEYFFDTAEHVSDESLFLLSALGEIVESATDPEIIDLVNRIKESGRRHGGEFGAKNAIIYMSAHPFSWLDFHHPCLWRKVYLTNDTLFVNLMSKPESRFTTIRKYLQIQRPDLCSCANPVELYMTVCNTPCYIPLIEEPTLDDLKKYGNDWCLDQYKNVKKISTNHVRAGKDFNAFMEYCK